MITTVEVSVKRCDPVPNSKFQTYDPAISTMSRDDLKALCNKITPNHLLTENPVAVAVQAEWKGRFDFWAKEEIKKAVAAINEDAQFRLDVIEELVLSGIARHVAAEMTNTHQKLMAKAREIKFI